MKYDMFISYRRSDRELVAAVVRRLEQRGISVWYDANIEAGADWRETIVDALTGSAMLVIFFSEECNSSRQLKKELAIADSLEKPVIPILIDNTQPRGAYLYELAERNWIQAWPEPMDRLEELVEHLATLAQGIKVETAHAPAQAAAAEHEPAAADDAQAPLAGRPAAAPQGSAPKIAAAYIGAAGRDGKPEKRLNDIPPFRWIDLAFLAPLWIASTWLVISANVENGGIQNYDRVTAAVFLAGTIVAGLYGAVVFPVRYYLRRRPVLEALWKYLASTVMIFVAALGIYLAGMRDGYLAAEEFGGFLQGFGIAWLAFALIAFLIYGALNGQRALRAFRVNLRKL